MVATPSHHFLSRFLRSKLKPAKVSIVKSQCVLTITIFCQELCEERGCADVHRDQWSPATTSHAGEPLYTTDGGDLVTSRFVLYGRPDSAIYDKLARWLGTKQCCY